MTDFLRTIYEEEVVPFLLLEQKDFLDDIMIPDLANIVVNYTGVEEPLFREDKIVNKGNDLLYSNGGVSIFYRERSHYVVYIKLFKEYPIYYTKKI